MEDDPLLRMHAVGIVEDAGFTALEAGNADEAVAC
jgi:two-component system, response regulator PdtaR